MTKSIIPKDDEYCYLCKDLTLEVKGTDVHHCIYGTGKRKLADEDGLTVHLCHFHHMRLHQMGDHKERLQKLAQESWMNHYGKTVDDFIERYGKSYL